MNLDKNTDGEFKFQSSHWLLAKISKVKGEHIKQWIANWNNSDNYTP